MKIERYSDELSIVNPQLSTDYPYPFIKKYHEFEVASGNDPAFIVSDDGRTIMPVKFFRRKIFRLAHILHPPLRDGMPLETEEEKIFLDEMILFFRKEKLCHKIIQPSLIAVFHSAPENSKKCHFGSYSINLENSTKEEIFARIQDRSARAILTAERKGCIVKYGKDQLPEFFKIFRDTMKRSNKYYDPNSYFEQFMHHLSEDSILCAVAYYEGQPQGGLFVPFTRHGGYFLYGGSVSNPAHNGIIRMLHWNVISLLKDKGVKKCFFGGARLSNTAGTKQEGIQTFKERLGCELETGYLWKMDIDYLYGQLYALLLNTKLRLSGQKIEADIIDFERRKEIEHDHE